MSVKDIEHRFNHHPPATQTRTLEHEDARHRCKQLAHHLDVLLPDGREKAVALTKLEETMFWANASLARAVAE